MEEVTVNRTRKRDDWALQMKRLSDEDYSDAKRIILVCDNLNTHIAAPYRNIDRFLFQCGNSLLR